jgi:hypothetical protein
VSRGHHSAFDTLAQRFPIRDRVLLGRLDKILSQLSHWAPIFAEVDYLPVCSSCGFGSRARVRAEAPSALRWAAYCWVKGWALSVSLSTGAFRRTWLSGGAHPLLA